MNPALLPSLALFMRIARHLSITRAAQEMGVSRAALSQALKALEQQLGVRLLHRTTRDMSLTEAGQRLLDTLGPNLAAVERAVEDLRENASIPSGLVRLNTSRLAYRALIEPRLAEFCGLYPDVRLEFVLSDELDNIIAEGCDLGIRLGHDLAEHVVAIPISGPVSMAVVASPAYIARCGEPQTPQDLDAHVCINYRYPGHRALRAWTFSEPGPDNTRLSKDVEGPLTFDDDAAMIKAALLGLGLVQIVDLAVQHHLSNGRLVQVMTKCTPRSAGFHLYAPSRHQVPARVRALRDFLANR
jgi:DNA-binding transcriptional LysR family regulator